MNEESEKTKETTKCNIDSVVKRFEELTKDRNICFMYDPADGYFIQISDKGTPAEVRRWKGVAEIIETKNHDLPTAMMKAIEFMEKHNEDFRKRIASFS